MMRSQSGWGDIGVPPAHFRALLYSATADMMIVHARFEEQPFQLSRLYGKTLAADRYTNLVPAADDETLEDPVVCTVTPSLYYLSEVLEQRHGRYAVLKDGHEPAWHEGETTGGWIRGVFRKDLVGGAVTAIVEYPIRQERNTWVSNLYAVAADGRTLVCSAAFVDSVSGSKRETAYRLCRLDVDTGTLTKLAPLRAVFF